MAGVWNMLPMGLPVCWGLGVWPVLPLDAGEALAVVEVEVDVVDATV